MKRIGKPKLIMKIEVVVLITAITCRFKPGRDIGSLEALLDRLSLRMDLPRGARHIFSMDGDRKLTLDELEDGASYVVSSYKSFKVSEMNFLFIIFYL